MEQFGLALILFAAFWVGCSTGYIAMRLRAQAAYEKGRNESAAEIAALQERLTGREQHFAEARQRADGTAEALQRMELELRQAANRRTVAEARLSLLPKYEAELDARAKKLAEQQKDLTRLYANVNELTARLEETRRSVKEKTQAEHQLQAHLAETGHGPAPDAVSADKRLFWRWQAKHSPSCGNRRKGNKPL